MKYIITLIIILTMCVWAQQATAGSWVPGTTTYATEDDMNGIVERVADYAYCNGISRFGKRGSFPDEEYTTFDCTIKRDDLYCTDWRLRAIKGSRPGYFKVKTIRQGDCY